MSPDPNRDTPPRGYPRASLVRCEQCGRTAVFGRADVLDALRVGRPSCCGLPMDLFIRAEWPREGDAVVTALPLTLPGSNDGTAIITRPPARTPPPDAP